MEAAGLALTIIPLITTTASGYTEVSQVIRRYKHFSEEVDELLAEVNVQRTIFRTTLRLLLASFIGDERAIVLISDENHGGWKDADLEACLWDRFSHCASAFTDSISLLRNRLVSLSRMSITFQSIVQDIENDNSLSMKRKARHIRKKIDLACSQNRIESLLKSLKDRTQDFRVLIQQSERLTEQRCREPLSSIAVAKVARLAAIKTVARGLYGAFGKACTKHIEHHGYIGLQPIHNNSNQVTFALALESTTFQVAPEGGNARKKNRMVWMTVESTIKGVAQADKPSGAVEVLNSGLKRTRTCEPPSPCKQPTPCSVTNQPEPVGQELLRQIRMSDAVVSKKQKGVTCQDEPMTITTVTTACQQCQIPPPDPLTNLCTHNNFCNIVRNAIRKPQLQSYNCIGFLETDNTSKHVVYVNSRTDTVAQSSRCTDMVTLSDLLARASIRDDSDEQLLPAEQFRMAKQLAAAVLQFDETHWLQDQWSSNDIIVSETGVNQSPSDHRLNRSLREPYANMSIRGQRTDSLLLSKRPAPYIRNRALFNLGKILLELAHRKPFAQLRKDEDMSIDSSADSDYFTAKRLLYSVSAKVGPRYSEIVRKCIECDFGQGDDLGCRKLQASFYQHVVCELESCESRLNGPGQGK